MIRLACLAVLTLVAPGATAELQLGGEPGATSLTYISLTQGPALTVPGIHGEILLSLTGAVPLATSILDATGEASLQVPVPAVASLTGTTLLVQTFEVGPPATGGDVSFSAPVFVGLR